MDIQSRRRVVITGLGAVTPLGNDVASTWAGIKAGKSGIGKITLFDASDYPVKIAAEVKDFSLDAYGLDHKVVRKMARFTRFLTAASLQAIRDAGYDESSFGADASGIGNARVIDEMNLLSDAEVQKLDAQLAAVERTHHIRILAAIVGDWKDKPLKPLAENIIKTIAPGGENGAVLLLLTVEDNNYSYYVTTDAKLRTRITDGDGIDYLAEQFIPALKENKYSEGFTAFAAAVDEMVTYYEKEGKPFTTGGALSAVARAVAQLYKPTSGEVIFNGKDLTQMRKTELLEARKNIQMVFQDPYASLNPRMTTASIIAEPLYIYKQRGIIEMTDREIDARVEHLMELVGLSKFFKNLQRFFG